MKLLAVFLISFFLGAFSAWVYYENKIANINEGIISKEIQLLSLATNEKIPCNQLLESNNWVQINNEEFTVFWRLLSDREKATKLVIDKNNSTALEIVQANCLEK